MAKTLGDLKDQIVSDLRRTNLGPEIAAAIPTAIRDHDSERFWFNQTYPQAYALTISANGGIPSDTVSSARGDCYALNPQQGYQEFIMIDEVRAQLSPPLGVWYTVKQTDWQTVEHYYSTLSNGQPSWWATENGCLRIYPLPPPGQSYPLRIFGHVRLIPLAADTDQNAWTNAGFDLIRYTVLKRLYSFPIRDAAQVQNAEQAGARCLDYLRRETSRRVRKNRMKAYYG